MSKLLYKTKNGATPNGRPRVYFCCHPNDFDRYFDEITDEILDRQNCAVFYLEDMTAEYDELFFTDLGQMQLFVMPVTSLLLCTDNRALDVEFKFAVDNHIPVLPLMQEDGLVDLFNEKCGDLQYLDKNNTDSTAISYDEKLTKYLESVLIGDELAKKIRDAFDAYVFLSYRKKDRQYAKELMRLIHKNEFCRDIAIWYDEFLVPGENFNDSIKEALEKSGLFVLAVTPNLVNEQNYIMTTEYPMAKNADKPILPAELVPTDREQLKAKYEGIPTVTDAHDDEKLRSALLDAKKEMAIKENDGSAEHNFFIGLAYLGGIDVEVDHDRALSLITGAADVGLAEAMKKLVAMYREGMGVKRDYETAIEWQRKLVSLFESEYVKSKTDGDSEKYFNALRDLGNYLYELGKLNDAKTAYLQMETHCDDYMQINGEDNSHKRMLSISYDEVGDIYEAQGKLDKALERYQKSQEISEVLVKETETVKSHRDLSVSHNKVGDIYKAQGKLDKALECYQKSLAIDEVLAKDTETVELRRDLAISYERVGNIYEAQGKLDKALECYQKSLEIREVLVKETETVKSHRDLSVSYNKVGDIYEAQGKLDKALECYKKSLEIREVLVKETETIESRRDLSVSYDNVGDIYIAQKKLDKALECYKKSLEIRKVLDKETEAVKSRRDLSISYNKVGNIYEAQGKLDKALEVYKASIGISEMLVKETGTPEAFDDLAISCYNLSFVVSGFKKRRYLKRAYDIYGRLCREYPDIMRYKNNRDVISKYLNK